MGRPGAPASKGQSPWARQRPREPVSRGFDDLIGPKASSADANPPHAAIDQRSHGLKVRFESPCADVVSVAHLTSNHRRFPANFTHFSHYIPCKTCKSFGLRKTTSIPVN